jgi:hypothetical protein
VLRIRITLMRIRIQLFNLIRIRIQLPKIVKVHADPDPQHTSHKKTTNLTSNRGSLLAIVHTAPDMNKEVLVVGVLVPLLVHQGAVLQDAQPLGGNGAAQPGGGGAGGVNFGTARQKAPPLEWLHDAQEKKIFTSYSMLKGFEPQPGNQAKAMQVTQELT